MNMGFGMSMDQRLECYIRCSLCNRKWGKHADNCPQKWCEELADKLLRYRCPACKEYAVDTNNNDWFECRKCHKQFSAGIACGEDADKLKETFIITDKDEAVRVVQMERLGEGNFPKDKRLQEYAKMRDKALKNALQRMKRAAQKERMEKIKAQESEQKLDALMEELKKFGNWQL